MLIFLIFEALLSFIRKPLLLMIMKAVFMLKLSDWI
ncbi:hypothetical protein ZPR_3955 [Zunongwangia profunda SM-A87]|uniref:Uncharacterized protein n=1 Tax=Zunongwangia profunda (strain DSM 18752 / CCTCC AB 206139 / SM-A87) TaxID=655815 RepID=D5BMB9_ZUNPS|nr:hypothetical protein ZPR_3955 [Zunongwangia profunda SM-A87]